MNVQASYFSITRNTQLSPGVISFLEEDTTGYGKPLGGILSDARQGWLALGPRLCVVDLKTGHKIAACTFGESIGLNASILCVCELPTPICNNTKQLIVSLACEDIGGLIIIFHCNGSQVLRCIQTKAAITDLTVIERTGGPLSCCDNLVVAGTEIGEIIVFDLNKSSLVEALKHMSQGNERLVRNEENSTNLAFLSLDDIELIEEQREIAVESGDHLAIILNDVSFLNGEYILRNPDGSVRMKAKTGYVNVTKLLHVPQLGSVMVGFNFGAFQIWNIVRMCLEYTSPVNVECLPVTHFGFQEPCDDPRAFCYLWVVYSSIDKNQDACPLAVMYSLTYQGKRLPGSANYLYQDFASCSRRFELDLTSAEPSLAAQITGGRCVMCHTYCVPSSLYDGDEGVMNLCLILWESWTENQNNSTYSLLLFDLDQWYKGHMPERWCIGSNMMMSVSTVDCPVSTLDCRMPVSTLCPYVHVQRLDEHFYPNSLQYGIVCLSTDTIAQLSTTGIQRQILSSMDEMGPACMLNPTPLYEQCLAAGLTPLYAELYHNLPEVNDQRKFLLYVALEGRLVGLLKKCAGDWASGTHSGSGCSLQLLVMSCWQRASMLKRAVDSIECQRSTLRRLEHCVSQLTLIVNLLESVITKCCNLVVPDALSDIEERCKTISTLTTYLRAFKWFISVGLMPESSMEQEAQILHNREDRLPYPVDSLKQKLEKRRIKLSCLEGKSGSDKSTDGCRLLYIDQLIEWECGGKLVHDLWRTDDNPSGLYPPPSLESLLRVYLLPDIADQSKHSLLLYLLLDVSSVFVDSRYEAILRKLMQFPTMFGLSNAAIKTTQAFWHLDNRNFDFALDQLQCVSNLSEWQHSVVLSSLLAQNKTRAGLQYVRGISNTHSDWRYCCELYLSRSLVLEALEVVRAAGQNISTAEKIEMLNFYFDGCKKTGHLSKILQIGLTPLEEEAAIKYLQASGEKQCADILVMFYIQQARYLEAQRYNNKIKQTFRQSESVYSSMGSLYETNIDRDVTRNTLVDLVCGALPKITDKVKATMDVIPATPKMFNVKPMSVFVPAKSPNNFVYKSSFIQNSIENASETWTRRPRLAHGLKRALQIEETPFLCTPKLSKIRSDYIEDMEEYEEGTPRKQQKMEAVSTPRTPHRPSAHVNKELLSMLDIPKVDKVPEWKLIAERTERSIREATPQSILKVRRTVDRDVQSPVDSRYLVETDEELETGSRHSNYTHASDKHLRFDLPSSSDSSAEHNMEEEPTTLEDRVALQWTQSESPKSESAWESPERKYKDTVRARLSHSLSASSSLSNSPRSPIETLSDIPVMIINPRFSAGDREPTADPPTPAPGGSAETLKREEDRGEEEVTPITLRGRPSIRSKSVENVTARVTRSHSKTPDSPESPSGLTWSSPRPQRMTRSKTPELMKRSSKESSNLESIAEQPKLETVEESLSKRILRTPEKTVRETIVYSQRKSVSVLETVAESPVREAEETASSPLGRSLRSRSKTPDVESPKAKSPAKVTRGKSKTPERESAVSPKLSITKSAKKKPLSRLVMEANIFSKISKPNVKSEETLSADSSKSEYLDNASVLESPSESILESTPMKDKPNIPVADYEFSPIVNKSVLGESDMSILSYTPQSDTSVHSLSSSKSSTTFSATFVNKSVLCDYKSSSDRSESNSPTVLDDDKPKGKVLDYSDSPTDPLANESVLKDVTSTPAESIDASALTDDLDDPITSITEENAENVEFEGIQKEKQSIVEIEREIGEIEELMEGSVESSSTNESDSSNSDLSDERDTEEHTVDSGNDTETEESAQEDDENSREDVNNAAYLDPSQVISLDSSDEEGGSPKKAEFSGSSDSDNPPLQINLDNIEEKSSDSASRETDELERNIDSNIDVSLSQTIQADVHSVEIDKDLMGDTEVEKESGHTVKDTSEQAIDISKPINVFNEGNLSIMTEDNSVLESDRSHMDSFVPDVIVQETEKDQEIVTAEVVEDMDVDAKPKEAIVMEDLAVIENEPESGPSDDKDKPLPVSESIETPVITGSADIGLTEEKTKVQESSVITEEVSKPAEIITEEVNIVSSEEQIHVTGEIKPNSPKSLDETDNATLITKEKVESDISEKVENATQGEDESKVKDNEGKVSGKLSKRRTSNKSNKSNKSDDQTPKTPKRRRSLTKVEPESSTEKDEPPAKIATRRSSNKSNKSIESPEHKSEVGSKITTRRTSKEHSKSPAKEVPLRRSTRRSSKQSEEDGESVKSSDSKTDDVKAAPIRKQRKSLAVSSKPELSVIPEVEDSGVSKLEESSQVAHDYSSVRRLTRNQSAVLERSLEPRPVKRSSRLRSGGSVASNVSTVGSEGSLDESLRDPFGVPAIDPISLLNKGDFEGPRDVEEMSVISEEKDSPDTIASKASKSKGASETGSILGLRHSRRLSTDIERGSPTPSLDVSLTGSPSRPRRSSFTKALDALTPKRRRSSVDVPDGDGSGPGSPAPQTSQDAEANVTPMRRTRRTSSTKSTGSVTKRSPARRNLRSTSIAESIEESEETKSSKKK